MNRRLFATLLTAAAAIAPVAVTPSGVAYAQSVMRPSADVVLSVGRGQLVTVPGNMTDIFVANEAIADVQVKSQRQLYVFGLSGGETTVYASNAAGDVVWAANVRVGSNIDSIDQMLALAMPEAKVSVATMGSNTVLLTGTVAAPEDAAEAERLVKAFVGENSNVVSRLKTATPLQVNLQVKFAEVSRSLVRTLGANLTSIDSSSGFQFGVGSGREGFASSFRPNSTPGGSALGAGSKVKVQIPDINNPGKYIQVDGTAINTIANGTTLSGAGKLLGLDLLGALDLAERDGLVTTLSQPNLTALSGETADFLAGGEFPILTSQGLGTTSVEYKKYGVSLAYTPTVLANGRISIRVRPEVSELSSQGAVTMNNFTVPALTVRRAETTVELGSGQSFMIAGLLSNSSQNAIDKAPGLGDVPILGNLFKSTEFQKGQTELVIVVTPYLVNPVDANDIKLPTDGLRSPTTAQQLLGNIDNDGVTGGDRPKPQAVGQGANAPRLGMDDYDTSGDDKDRPRSGKAERRADAEATPGFSLK
ncbi:type II and III secretion system protein family protein [Altererythrobacter sp. CC-YST694]|uniref:type II and III secretion system protein family protein n=1 Tax=Altererythrobacter sp. CC-YST694 TaxID=2755038 RepID=UPI001D00C310|nr:type II and III secretion system protein family protein [Altererythrobacter sp. CC-YST694]MCB5426239.1 type II and III secretion system protein family protein [Altererythrobacter sp. CC-YST694]